jgi:chromosome segregation ATPase
MASEEANSISSDNLPNLSNTKEEAQELNKIPYVKDLLVKIDVLKKGIIGERKKNSALSAQNKQLETEINTKENEIRKLCKEKVDLENQLQLEKKKLAKKEESFLQMANAFGKSSAINNTNKFGLQINFLKKNEEKAKEKDNNMINFINNNEKIDKLNSEIEKLKLENENYKKKFNEASTQNENLKNEFKTLIKTQSEKLFNTEEDNKKLKIENQKLINEIEIKNKIVNENNAKKHYFDKMIQELEENKNNLYIQLQNCLNKCEKLVIENQTYRERLHQHQIDETILGEKLAEYKNVLIKINTKVQIYQVLKVGLISNSRLDITFGQDKDNNYVMRIDDDSKRVELVNMLDVDYFKQIGDDKVEISYMYESKKKTFTVIVEEIIIDQFMDAYKNLFSEAIKTQTKE